MPTALHRSHLLPLTIAIGCSIGALACTGGVQEGASLPRARHVPPSGAYTEDLDPWESATPPALIGATGPSAEPQNRRRAGDRTLRRFSGTYRDQALVLLEEVVGVEGEMLIVDYQVLEGDDPVHLRVRMTKQTERVVLVEEIVDGNARPSSRAAFEDLMEKTAFAPDRNDGLLARKSQTCLAGQEEFDCQVSEFEVEVDGAPARLSVSRHPALLQDVAGEVTAIDGTILYKADLLEYQRGPVGGEADDAVALGVRPDWANSAPSSAQ